MVHEYNVLICTLCNVDNCYGKYFMVCNAKLLRVISTTAFSVMEITAQ